MNELHKQIFELFRLLDDIDTAGDMFKEDHTGYREYVEKKQKERWFHINEQEVNELYTEFMPNREVEE